MQLAMRHGKVSRASPWHAWQEGKKRIRRRGGKTMSWSVSPCLLEAHLMVVSECMLAMWEKQRVIPRRHGDERGCFAIGDGRLVAIDAW